MNVERPERYFIRGVSADKRALHDVLKGVPSPSFHSSTVGAFCQGLEFPKKNDFFGENSAKKPIFFHHADGAGSKPILAYLWWKESGSLEGFKAVAEDALVMNTDDLLSVGVVSGFSFSSIISRNAQRIPSEVLQTLMKANHDFVEKLNSWGIEAHMAGGETADVGDSVSTLLVDATACAFGASEEIIHPSRVKGGDFIVGFASFGQASYEKSYNSGLGCNGVTSARHDILSEIYRENYPETFDAQTPLSYVYSGDFRLSDDFCGGEKTADRHESLKTHQVLLSPTRTYLPLLARMKKEGFFPKIAAIFHNTGGGLTKCLRFGRSIHYVKHDLFPFPPIFSELAKKNTMREMFQTFNCGHRLEIVVHEQKVADEMIALAADFGIAAKIIGQCHHTDGENRLTIQNNNEEYFFKLK